MPRYRITGIISTRATDLDSVLNDPNDADEVAAYLATSDEIPTSELGQLTVERVED